MSAVELVTRPRGRDFQVNCQLWQTRLRLLDWQVTAQVVLPGTIGENVLGQVRFRTQFKDAEISLVIEGNDHVEETLVHELLHLHFLAWDTEAAHEDEALETALNLIATALVVGDTHD